MYLRKSLGAVLTPDQEAMIGNPGAGINMPMWAVLGVVGFLWFTLGKKKKH
jgi:hypothetical protein